MKRKSIKYLILTAVLLVFAMVVTACGSGSQGGGTETKAEAAAETAAEETTTEAFDPVGVYKASVDMTDSINAGMAEAGLAFSEAKVSAILTMELTDDGKYILDMDGDSLAQSVKDAFEVEGSNLLKQAFTAQGLSEDDLESVAQGSGYDSFEAMADELVAQLQNQLEDEMDVSVAEEAHAEGTYTVDGQKLKLSSGEEGEFTSNTTLVLDAKIGDSEIMKMEFSK